MRLAFLILLLMSCSVTAQMLTPPKPGKPNAGVREFPPSELDSRLAQVSDVGELLTAARTFSQRGQHLDSARAWRRLVELRPHSGDYRLEMAAELAMLDYKSLVYNALLHLQTQGYAYDFEADPRFALVKGTEVWTHIINGFEGNRETFGEGKVLYTLPKEDLLIESLAWDSSRKKLLVGSARTGSVYTVESGGKLKPLLAANEENGMWAVFDIAVDAERGVLWVASTAVPHFRDYQAEADLGAAGVFKFDLKTGKFIKRFLSPQILGQQFFMSSLALGPDGALYAADGVNNAIYMVRDDQLTRLAHNPVLSSIRGMAVSGDGKVLYFADYERGLFGIALDTMKPFALGLPKTLAVGGIDGLTMSGNHLVIVQNGMVPNRVMKLGLDQTGRLVESVAPIEANRDELVEPTLATLDGDRLLFIANSQKDNYDRFGLVRDKNKLVGTSIFETTTVVAESPPLKAPASGG
jgi:sugar lactone lactonase YvrE